MKILHLVPDMRSSAGGIASAVTSLVSTQLSSGIDANIISLASDRHSPLAAHIVGLGDVRHQKRAKTLREILRAAKLEEQREGSRVLCHSHGLWSPLNHQFCAFARSEAIPYVVSLHGMLMPFARRHKRLKKALAWRLYQHRDLKLASALHVTSDTERCFAEAWLTSAKWAEIPLGVDFGREVSREGRQRAPGSELQRRTVLFMGRLHPIKNLDNLIRAFGIALSNNWQLRIVGPDEVGHAEHLMKLVRRLGLNETVSIEGPVFGAEKERLLNDVDLFVLPSFSENFGMVVAEALAANLPVVASAGTPWSAIETHRCGWWVPPTLEGLLTAFRGVDEKSQDELIQMGARGRSFVERELSWKSTNNGLLELYTKM